MNGDISPVNNQTADVFIRVRPVGQDGTYVYWVSIFGGLVRILGHAVDDEGVDGEEAGSVLIAQGDGGWRAEHTVKDPFGFYPEILSSVAFLSGLGRFGMESVRQLDRDRTLKVEFEDQRDNFGGKDGRQIEWR